MINGFLLLTIDVLQSERERERERERETNVTMKTGNVYEYLDRNLIQRYASTGVGQLELWFSLKHYNYNICGLAYTVFCV